MSRHIQQVEEVNNNGVATRSTRVAETETEASGSTLASRIIWYIAGVIVVLLALRFALVLLGANPNNGFVSLIYSLSYPFAAPFFGIFGYRLNYGVSKFELSTLLAMAVYVLVAWGLSRLVTISQR
jgi:hypothetical protein